MEDCPHFSPLYIEPPDGTINEDTINDNNTIYRSLKKLKRMCKYSMIDSDLTANFIFCRLNILNDYKSSAYSHIHKRQYQPDFIKDNDLKLKEFHKEFPPKGIKLLKKK